jgi:hypothetical protein
MDHISMDWVQAWVRKTAPAQGKVGLMSMLAGGTDASNTDPNAQKNTATNHWIKTGPHIMVVGADPSFYASYPRSPKPDASRPYVILRHSLLAPDGPFALIMTGLIRT